MLFYISKCIKVSKRFCHLFPINEEMSRMYPVATKFFPSIGFTLSDFVLVMRKYVINSSHMEINLWTKILHNTSTTLYMPSRATLDKYFFFSDLKLSLPKIIPISFFVITFPKYKVSHTFFFILIIIDSNACFHSLYIEICELSVAFKFFYTIVDTSIVSEIGKSFF